MTCNNYTNATECPETFFSTSYQDAREKFLAAAEKAKAEIEHHLVLRRGNVDYYIDTAFFRGKKPEKLFVHASGTHGVEGYTGSAIQTKLLREWNATCQDGPSILFVHAINPYGMTHNRRFNENNVDLNRNYLNAEQWTTVKTRDPNVSGYETFRQLLSPPCAPRFVDRYWFLYNAASNIVRYGFAPLKRAVVTGQYHHKEGIYFGGDGEQKSVTLLRAILKKHAVGVTDAIFLDVHTGLGPTGIDTIMCNTEEDAERSRQIFAGNRVQSNKDAKDGPSEGYDLALGIIWPREELGPNVLSIAEEFGTISSLYVARAMVLENQAYQYCNGSYVHEVMGQWMRDAFYPQDLKYKTSILKLGPAAFWNCVKHLSA